MNIKKLFNSFLVITIALLLTGCELSVLQPKGMIAIKEINIMIISAALMLVVVIPVILMTIIFSWRYRETNLSARYSPDWSHNVILEIIWWSIPCCIIAILATITWISSHELDPFKPLASSQQQHSLRIQVIALEWKWLFIYPEQNIATVNYVQLPAGVPVNFEITSEGPMNSFIIPQLAGQIYAMAGMQSKLHLIANEVGDYPGFSSNFSGKGFADMKFNTHVSTNDEFDQWVGQIKQVNHHLSKAEYDLLAIPSENFPVTYYSSANLYLFKIATMKSMMPEKEVEALCKQQSWV